jgi:hypothetical protein
VKQTRPAEEEKETPGIKMPAEKDLERHLDDVNKAQPKEKLKKEEPKKETPKKEEAKEKKPPDTQLERAVELLKSWEIFKNLAKKKP